MSENVYRSEEIPDDLQQYFEPLKQCHPTVKSVVLFAYLIEFLTKPGALVLDPFLGSGTTLCACAQTGRAGIGIELKPDYMDIACCRVEEAVRKAEQERAQLKLEVRP